MEVDVERLARAIHAATASSHYQALSSVTMFVCQVQAEAVLADLTAQGFAVVRREELEAVRPNDYGEWKVRGINGTILCAISPDQTLVFWVAEDDPSGPMELSGDQIDRLAATLHTVRAALTAAPDGQGPATNEEGTE